MLSANPLGGAIDFANAAADASETPFTIFIRSAN